MSYQNPLKKIWGENVLAKTDIFPPDFFHPDIFPPKLQIHIIVIYYSYNIHIIYTCTHVTLHVPKLTRGASQGQNVVQNMGGKCPGEKVRGESDLQPGPI